jgi:hypothetical protein
MDGARARRRATGGGRVVGGWCSRASERALRVAIDGGKLEANGGRAVAVGSGRGKRRDAIYEGGGGLMVHYRTGLDWIGLDLWKSPCLLWLVFLFLLGGEEDPGVVVLPRQLTVKRREDTIIGHL